MNSHNAETAKVKIILYNPQTFLSLEDPHGGLDLVTLDSVSLNFNNTVIYYD
jgi:hypothetical protein